MTERTPILHTIPSATAELGIGRTTLFHLIATGALPARKIGRRTLIAHDDLVEFAKTLGAAEPGAPRASGSGPRR
jgi:excisionase family DNA binding protein